jgi:hypothetical protein
LFGRKESPPLESLAVGLRAGALYSTFNGDESGDYGVVKLLVLELPVAHIRVYLNRYPERPTEVDLADLSLGNLMGEFEKAEALREQGIEYSPEFGIAHMPVHLRDFALGWKPVFLLDDPVTEEELMGYKLWKSEGGGVFGGL